MATVIEKTFDFITRASIRISSNPDIVVRSDVSALKTLLPELKSRRKELAKMKDEIGNKKKIFEKSSLKEKEKWSGKLIRLNQKYGVLKGKQLAGLNSAIQRLESIVINLLAIAHRQDILVNHIAKGIGGMPESLTKKSMQAKIKDMKKEEKSILHDAFLGAKSLDRKVISTQTIKKWSLQGSLIKLRRIRQATILNDTIQKKLDSLMKNPSKEEFDMIFKLGRQKIYNVGEAIHKTYQLIHRLEKILEHMNDAEAQHKFDTSLANLVSQTRRAWADIK